MSINKMQYNASDILNYPANHHDPTTQTNYANNVKNWVETEKNLVDVILWQPTTAYSVGNMVKTPSLPSQYCLVCITAGTSGANEPSYSGVSLGDSVSDGSITWRVEGTTMAATKVVTLSSSNFEINSGFKNLSGTITIVGGYLAVLDMQVAVENEFTPSGTYFTYIGNLKIYSPKVVTVNLEVQIENAGTYSMGFTANKAILSKPYPAALYPSIQLAVGQHLYLSDLIHISGMWYI